MKLTILSSAVFICLTSAFVVDPTASAAAGAAAGATVHMHPLLDNQRNIAPLYIPSDNEVIADSYIVILKNTTNMAQHHEWVMAESTAANDMETNLTHVATTINGIQHTYASQAWQGYSGRFTEGLLDKIRRSPDVDYVEKDSVVYATDVQQHAPWGLARMSHRNKLTLETFNKYPFDDSAGAGIKVYVIDTGINVGHEDFEGRASWGVTIPEGDPDEDGNGHGSHCAGTIAGKRFGVAKKAEVIAVKVLRSNGSGSMSGVLAGVSWTTAQHQKEMAANTKYKGAVANMSLGGGRSRSLNMAIDEAVNSGIVVAAAAGNDNRDACQYSPASAENAIAVGASNVRDERAYFSNHGSCVDIIAPGENILSTWIGSIDATNTISGTSMAAPHVAGLAAYFMSMEKQDGLVSPKLIRDKILQLATPGKLTNLPENTTNLLIFNDAPAF